MRSPQTNLREREYQNSSKRFGRVTLEKAGLHAHLFFREGEQRKLGLWQLINPQPLALIQFHHFGDIIFGNKKTPTVLLTQSKKQLHVTIAAARL